MNRFKGDISWPRLKDGSAAWLGQAIEKIYINDLWIGKIVGLHIDGTIDIQYMNKSTHSARYCVTRHADAGQWGPRA
jgi:hypothetical protein